MKNLFLSTLLVLLSLAGYAHSSGMEIINQSSCEINVQIRGSKECGPCALEYFSNMIVVPGGGSVLFPNTMTLGGSFPAAGPVFLHSAVIYSGPRHCQPQNWVIGSPKCNLPAMIHFFAQDQNCRIMCDRLTARWLPVDCPGIARLVVTP